LQRNNRRRRRSFLREKWEFGFKKEKDGGGKS
jgi:hypothetical protein